MIPILPALLAHSGLDRLLFDDTFAGIHQLSWFDWAIADSLLQRSGHSVGLWSPSLRNHSHLFQAPQKAVVTQSPGRFDQLPPVTIQLPLYNERYVVERLIDEVIKIDYPRELLQIQVLDDSTDDTHRFAEVAVRALSDTWVIRSNIITARTAHGYKAGALQEGLKTATGEFVAIFDADFIPPTDFLYAPIHHFADPKVGVVQTRWSYLNREYNFLTEVEALLLDGHFILEHGARSRAGLLLQFQRHGGYHAPLHD